MGASTANGSNVSSQGYSGVNITNGTYNEEDVRFQIFVHFSFFV